MTREHSQVVDHANVVVLPPLIFFVPLVISIIARYFIPLPLPILNVISVTLAVILVILGIALMAWSVFTFKDFKEKPDSRTPTKNLITKGPFQYTRNPMYVAFFLMYFGLAFALNSLWSFLFVPFAFWFLYTGVVLREELYMERKFGKEYRSYKKETRRFL